MLIFFCKLLSMYPTYHFLIRKIELTKQSVTNSLTDPKAIYVRSFLWQQLSPRSKLRLSISYRWNCRGQIRHQV